MFLTIIIAGLLSPVMTNGNNPHTLNLQNVNINFIQQIEDISAIGYLPLWRVALTNKGVDIGMSSLNLGLFEYKSIDSTSDGWYIIAQNQGISISLSLKCQPTECTMSKQWYPYSATLTVKEPGKAKKKYNGTAIRKSQKPLPPHPDNPASQYVEDINNETIYKYIDKLKFCLMSKNFKLLSTQLCYPIRFNSTASSYLINDSEMFFIENE